MASFINLVLGFAFTFIGVMVAIYLFNKFTPGGVAMLGKEPVTSTIAGK